MRSPSGLSVSQMTGLNVPLQIYPGLLFPDRPLDRSLSIRASGGLQVVSRGRFGPLPGPGVLAQPPMLPSQAPSSLRLRSSQEARPQLAFRRVRLLRTVTAGVPGRSRPGWPRTAPPRPRGACPWRRGTHLLGRSGLWPEPLAPPDSAIFHRAPDPEGCAPTRRPRPGQRAGPAKVEGGTR